MFLLELAEGLVDLIERAHLVQGQTHDTALLCQGLEYALTNPPNGVGNELESTGFVELFCSLDEAQVALVDEVGQAETLVLVLLCYGNDETEVCTGEFLQGFLIALADTLCKFYFLFWTHEFFAADLLEILIQRGALAVGDALCNLKLSHTPFYTEESRVSFTLARDFFQKSFISLCRSRNSPDGQPQSLPR